MTDNPTPMTDAEVGQVMHEYHREVAGKHTEQMQSLVDGEAARNQTLANGEAARNAQVDQIEQGLEAIVRNITYFHAILDPDEANPTLVDGGTFNTFSQIASRTFAGSWVLIEIPKGKSVDFDQGFATYGRSFLIRQRADGTDNPKPVIRFKSYTASNNTQYLHGFTPYGNSSVKFQEVSIVIEDKPEGTPNWGYQAHIMRYAHGSVADLGFSQCEVQAPSGVSLASVNGGSVVNLGLYNTILDGPFVAVQHASAGSAVIAHHTLTLANGATLHNGGTVGVNLLIN